MDSVNTDLLCKKWNCHRFPETRRCLRNTLWSPFSSAAALLGNKALAVRRCVSRHLFCAHARNQIVTWHNSKHQSLQSEAWPFWFCQHASVGSGESNSGRVFHQKMNFPERISQTTMISTVTFVSWPLMAFRQKPENVCLSQNVLI